MNGITKAIIIGIIFGVFGVTIMLIIAILVNIIERIFGNKIQGEKK